MDDGTYVRTMCHILADCAEASADGELFCSFRLEMKRADLDLHSVTAVTSRFCPGKHICVAVSKLGRCILHSWYCWYITFLPRVKLPSQLTATLRIQVLVLRSLKLDPCWYHGCPWSGFYCPSSLSNPFVRFAIRGLGLFASRCWSGQDLLVLLQIRCSGSADPHMSSEQDKCVLLHVFWKKASANLPGSWPLHEQLISYLGLSLTRFESHQELLRRSLEWDRLRSMMRIEYLHSFWLVMFTSA